MHLNHYILRNYAKHLGHFMEKLQLFPKSGDLWIGVSGGLDSMALAVLMSELRKQRPREIKAIHVLHVNHGTRTECEAEARVVEKLCLELGLDFKLFKLKLNIADSNFEHTARTKRYQAFFKQLKTGDAFYTAHHIDDSFEWSLMQNFKSAKFKSALGIPVFNGTQRPVVRPLMAFTRLQLETLQYFVKFPYCSDPSNEFLDFERNYVRKVIIPKIRQRFPGYLKHYAHRANSQAKLLGLHRLQSLVDGSENTWIVGKTLLGASFICHRSFERKFYGSEDIILPLIEHHSQKGRGELRSQLRKLILAAEAGKEGPLSFSGKVMAYIGQGIIVFFDAKMLEKYKSLDEQLLEWLQQQTMEDFEFPKALEQKDLSKLYFPFLIFCDPRCLSQNLVKKYPSLKKTHPLFPKSTAWAKTQGLWFQTLPRMLYLQRKSDKRV